MKVTVLYHFFYPDDVVSARIFQELCLGLVERGWDVEVLTSNRSRKHEGATYAPREEWEGIRIRRIWRPDFSQDSSFGRIANAIWMLIAWSTCLLCRRKKDEPKVVIVGTDPIFSVLTAAVVRLFKRRVRFAHWCFDLYPEAAIADGMFGARSAFVRFCKALMGWAYRACDYIVDLGPCMRERLLAYSHKAQHETIVPWALSEPAVITEADAAVRAKLFGEAKLGILYSGSLGRGHPFETFVRLGRELKEDGVAMCFSVRGESVSKLRDMLSDEDNNIRLIDFVPEEQLVAHLSAADILMVSLHETWTGTVVPSKFFGCLAIGRPVLFSGSERSGISRWIHQHQLGWHVSDSVDTVAEELRGLIAERAQLEAMRKHCREVYGAHFSGYRGYERWNEILRKITGKNLGGTTDTR